ncbi:hypothetical protein L1987_16519 [Smallanthus sonchifolius]|uniref:Uncharacterized protein n=1 Tax=Smallanthus sonchifolius TaxID=185202 RepID=A0ACB9J9E6_9ASTR|nr:hypothetical protein L1987_16519 [Smallanthus sonchifolius]
MDDEATAFQADKPQPVHVLHNGVCILPTEYCEARPDFKKSKPRLIQKAPQLYPDLTQESNSKDVDGVSDQLQSPSIVDGSGPSGSSVPKREQVKRLPTEKDQIDVEGETSPIPGLEFKDIDWSG